MASRYWVGGTGTWDASDTTHWSTSTGGGGGASVPSASDAVILDDLSGGGKVTLGTSISVTSITMNTYTGEFDSSTYDVTLVTFANSGTSTRTLTMGSGTWTLTGNNATIFNQTTITGLTFNKGTKPIICNYSGSTGTRTIRFTNLSALGNLDKHADFSITAGSDTIAMTSTRVGRLNFTGFTGTWSNGSLVIYGDLTLGTGMTTGSGASNLSFYEPSATTTLTSNGVVVNQGYIMNATGGTLLLADDFSSSTTLRNALGTITANDNVTTSGYSTATGSSMITNMGTGTWTLTGVDATYNVWQCNSTINKDTADIKLTNSSNSDMTFAGNGKTFNDVWFDRSGSTGTITISGSNTFNDFKDTGTEAHTIKFTAGTTTTVSTFNVNGETAGDLITLTSTTTTPAILSKTGSEVSCDYLSISYITGSPANTWYAGIHSVDGGGNTYIYFDRPPIPVASQTNNKHYLVKVYDKESNFLTTWTDVQSEINFNQELNSAGGQLQITLARDAGDYGEGSDVDFGHIVKVYSKKGNTDNETLLFKGYITTYTPVYSDNNVVVTLLSTGMDLDKLMYSSEVTVINYEAYDDVADYDYIPQSWAGVPYGPSIQGDMGIYIRTGASTTTIKSFEIALWWNKDYQSEYQYPVTFKLAKARAGMEEDNPDWDPFTVYGTKILPVGTKPHYSNKLKDYVVTVNFDEAITVSPNTIYWVCMEARDVLADYNVSSTKNYSMHFWSYNNYLTDQYNWQGINYPTWLKNDVDSSYSWAGGSGGWGGPTFAYYEADPTTTFVFVTTDPSIMLMDIIDYYQIQGGLIVYTDDSISMTGLNVDYTFKSSTAYEAIKKVLELCPTGWYWYIDYSTDVIYLKEISTSPDHTFSLEKNIIDIKIEKRIEDLVNTIYFTGGDDGSGENYYQVFKNQTSIDLYGIKSTKYTDNRVTNATTAENMCNTIFETKAYPELRVNLTILDNCNNQGMGYDIESIKVGDIVAVRNVNQTVGLSSWDVARWDEAYWDFNIQNLSSLSMVVQKINYKGDSLDIEASTMSPDINKKLDDINRQLENLQTLNNPDAPA